MSEIPPQLRCAACGEQAAVLDPGGRCPSCELADRLRRSGVSRLEWEMVAHNRLYASARQALGPDHATTNWLGRALIRAGELAELDRKAEEPER